MWHHNVDLLADHDLDGRSGLKLALQEAGGRFFLYVAGGSGAGVPVTAPVRCPAVGPGRLHPATARPARQQPGQQVPSLI